MLPMGHCWDLLSDDIYNSGFCSSSRGVYITAIPEALDISRSTYALSGTFRYVTTTICNTFFGVLIAKLGARKMIAAGFAATIISTLLYAFGNHVVYFYIGSIFLGLGVAWTTTTMVGAVVSKWFAANRGSVMGAVLAANGLGVSLAMPLETIMVPIYAADLFGEHSYNKLLGIVFAVNTAGYALGSPVANLCYDITGSYNIALYGGAALMVVATVVMQFVISAAHKEQKKVE